MANYNNERIRILAVTKGFMSFKAFKKGAPSAFKDADAARMLTYDRKDFDDAMVTLAGGFYHSELEFALDNTWFFNEANERGLINTHLTPWDIGAGIKGYDNTFIGF